MSNGHGGRREGAGTKRPRRLTASITLACTPEQRAQWKAASEASGEPLRVVAREMLDTWSDEVLAAKGGE